LKESNQNKYIYKLFLTQVGFRQFARFGKVDRIHHLPMQPGFQTLKGFAGIRRGIGNRSFTL
ncbi:MAG: hypothetical protein RLO18_28475, partial [Gimesia chilikensis]